MKTLFQFQFYFRVNGLHCILITDRDGVPLVRSVTERAPQLALRPNFISTFGMATDQASKLGLGRNKTIISMYSSYQVIISICIYACVEFFSEFTSIILLCRFVYHDYACVLYFLIGCVEYFFYRIEVYFNIKTIEVQTSQMISLWCLFR